MNLVKCYILTGTRNGAHDKGRLMSNDKKMFCDCISDDVIYIRQFKQIHIDNVKKNLVPSLCLPSLCRMLINSICTEMDYYRNYTIGKDEIKKMFDENLIHLTKNIKLKDIHSYESFEQKIIDKVNSFTRFLKAINGYNCDDKDIWYNFIAISFARNALTHMTWENFYIRDDEDRARESKYKRRFLNSRGLPDNFMKFESKHWDLLIDTQERISKTLNFTPIAAL